MRMTDKYNDMSIECVYKRLAPLGAIRDVPMRAYTTFRIGGAASVLFTPKDENELLQAVQTANECGVPYYILGSGSNVLISDAGVNGVVIRICYGFGGAPVIDENLQKMMCSAGIMISNAVKSSVEAGFMGLEWAYGIPGTIGGAVAMNAGAYGGEIKQTLFSARVIKNGELTEHIISDSDMGYRTSILSYPNAIVVGATFLLKPDDGHAAERMREYTERRREKQPLDLPSAGSVFKRPEGNYAGALIEQAGLKGHRIGGAEVSELHAGFIVNRGGATAHDVLTLISFIKKRVYEHSGIMLEEELKVLGDGI